MFPEIVPSLAENRIVARPPHSDGSASANSVTFWPYSITEGEIVNLSTGGRRGLIVTDTALDVTEASPSATRTATARVLPPRTVGTMKADAVAPPTGWPSTNHW